MHAAAKVLVIASGNAGKVREFGKLLADLGLETQQQPEGLEVEETGHTFAENARLKAKAVASATGCWALADDSGLSVDALGGAPGVHSARYAGGTVAAGAGGGGCSQAGSPPRSVHRGPRPRQPSGGSGAGSGRHLPGHDPRSPTR